MTPNQKNQIKETLIQTKQALAQAERYYRYGEEPYRKWDYEWLYNQIIISLEILDKNAK